MSMIWKYPLSIRDAQDVSLLEGSEILTVQMQGDVLCLWALASPGTSIKRRRIEIFGTGNPIPEGKRRYIATVQMAGGSLVWHVFENLE